MIVVTQEQIMLESPEYTDDERTVYGMRSNFGKTERERHANGHIGVLVYRAQRLLFQHLSWEACDGIWGPHTDSAYDRDASFTVGPGLFTHIRNMRTKWKTQYSNTYARQPKPQ